MWAKISAVLGFIGVFLYALLQKEKKERVEDELEIEKETQELSDKSTEAMVKGLENEAHPIIRNNRTIG